VLVSSYRFHILELEAGANFIRDIYLKTKSTFKTGKSACKAGYQTQKIV
jgi:hypothetical protein